MIGYLRRVLSGLNKLLRRKKPLDKVIEAGHFLLWGTIDTKNPHLQDPHGCGFIDHLGNCIDVTGRSDVKKLFEPWLNLFVWNVRGYFIVREGWANAVAKLRNFLLIFIRNFWYPALMPGPGFMSLGGIILFISRRPLSWLKMVIFRLAVFSSRWLTDLLKKLLDFSRIRCRVYSNQKIAQPGRALNLGFRGWRFESVFSDFYCGIQFWRTGEFHMLVFRWIRFPLPQPSRNSSTEERRRVKPEVRVCESSLRDHTGKAPHQCLMNISNKF